MPRFGLRRSCTPLPALQWSRLLRRRPGACRSCLLYTSRDGCGFSSRQGGRFLPDPPIFINPAVFLWLCLSDVHFIWFIRALSDLACFLGVCSKLYGKGQGSYLPCLFIFYVSIVSCPDIRLSVPFKMQLRGFFHRITATGAADRLRKFA